ncbi:hypothetical protein [Streptomyces sp. NPDC001594]|uniref:hypothetical protein n=1 Tax=Streptomyces sp. NPDC001594 TaxID=3364590 RepID=UPI0036D0776A
MRTPKSVLLLTLLLTLSGCGLVGGDRGPRPRVPMPSEVPTGPVYTSVDDVVTALGKGGFDCKVILRNENKFGSDATCEVQHRQTTVTNEISVLSTDRYGRDDVGDSIDAGRRAFGHTIVAAGNWFIWVRPGVYAHDMAAALPGAVVLEPLPAKGK